MPCIDDRDSNVHPNRRLDETTRRDALAKLTPAERKALGLK